VDIDTEEIVVLAQAIREHVEQEPETILCVDDEPAILAALRRVFRPHGYRVLTAACGAQALEILEREAVGVVISDMSMPGMDGPTFLDRVRSRWPDTVRVLLTGHSRDDSKIEAIGGAEAYRRIPKPWDEGAVLVTVQHAFARRSRATVAE
jgi:CheY-like chemotaxis protein